MSTLTLEFGGSRLGDSWMRLIGLYSRAVLAPKVSLVCLVRKELCSLALRCFGDRLEVRESGSALPDWTVANVGLKGALKAVVNGQKTALPYHRAVRQAKTSITGRDTFSTLGLDSLEYLGVICQPPLNSLRQYQGISDILMFPELRAVSSLLLTAQIERDLPVVRKRVSGCPRRTLPTAIAAFPSGTDMQRMPPEWAKERIPGATYFFHTLDSLFETFSSHGLTCARFDTPEDLVGIALNAQHCVTTDSFPSHILQSTTDRATILLTHQQAPVVVHPAFRGSIRHSTAPCSPCIGPRANTHVCREGHTHCTAWKEHRAPVIESKEMYDSVQ